MHYGVLVLMLAITVAVAWFAGAGEAMQRAHGLSNLPTEVRPARHADYILAFGSFGPMPVEILSIDPSGRWVKVEFDADAATHHELPPMAWVHVEQITLIAPQGTRWPR